MNMTALSKSCFLTFFIGFIFTPSFAASQPDVSEKAPLMLGQGEQRLLILPGLKRFSLGGAAVKAVRAPQDLAKSALLLKGVSVGVADLWVWKDDGSVETRLVQVQEWAATQLSAGLRRQLGGLQETEVIAASQGLVLRGRVSSLKEAEKIARLRRDFSKELTDETELSDALLDSGEQLLREWVEKSAYSKQIRIQRLPGKILARGSLAGPSERKTLETRLTQIFPPVQVELDSLSNSASTIFFRVFLLELKKDQFQSFGVQWPGTVEKALHVTTQAIRDALSLDLAIHAMSQQGSAKILSKPEIAVRSPGEAELFAGGEIPIHNHGKLFSNTTWKSFGLTLKLKVLESTATEVRLEIQTEVSHLDSSIASDQTPGFRSNRMRTQVDAQFGTPLLLSGLLQEDIRKQARGIPGLRQIPILGALFGSEDFQKEQSELVAILLPQVLPPTPVLGRAGESLPKGHIPPARNWVSESDMRELQADPNYPWNAFEN